MGLICVVYKGKRSENIHSDWKKIGELLQAGEKLGAIKLYLKVKGRSGIDHLKREFDLSDDDIKELSLDPELEVVDVEFDEFGNIVSKNPVPKTLEERITELEERVRAIEEKLKRSAKT